LAVAKEGRGQVSGCGRERSLFTLVGQSSRLEFLACVTAQGDSATAEQTAKECLQRPRLNLSFFLLLSSRLHRFPKLQAGVRVFELECGVLSVGVDCSVGHGDGKRSKTGSDGWNAGASGWKRKIHENEGGGVVPCSLRRRLEGGRSSSSRSQAAGAWGVGRRSWRGSRGWR
jgi:hypothetical protein